MSFMDEKIARFISESEQAMSPRSICEGPVRIGKRYYEFEQQSFYEDQLSLYLPNDFQEMEQQIRSIKYPYEQRPEVIKTNEDGSINFTFKKINQPMQDDLVEKLITGMKTMLQKSNPSHVFYESGIEDINGKPIGYFEFKNMVIDGALFNIMYFLEFEGEILMGTFCCRYDDYPDWRDIAYQSIRTLNITVKEEEGELA